MHLCVMQRQREVKREDSLYSLAVQKQGNIHTLLIIVGKLI